MCAYRNCSPDEEIAYYGVQQFITVITKVTMDPCPNTFEASRHLNTVCTSIAQFNTPLCDNSVKWRPELDSLQRQGHFSLRPRPNLLWSSSTLVSDGQHKGWGVGPFPWGKTAGAWAVLLTDLVVAYGMYGAFYPRPVYASTFSYMAVTSTWLLFVLQPIAHRF
jgi:hypothetical protein